jgi:hypothetical protein
VLLRAALTQAARAAVYATPQSVTPWLVNFVSAAFPRRLTPMNIDRLAGKPLLHRNCVRIMNKTFI